jgi:hypothetical protein
MRVFMGDKKGHPARNINGEGGRPPRFTDEQIEIYADELIEWLKNPNNYWFKAFCLEKMIHPKYMTEWANKNVRFKEAYNLAETIQEFRLLNGGLKTGFNCGLVKFCLNVKHGWVDTTKIQNEVRGDAQNGSSKDLVYEDPA